MPLNSFFLFVFDTCARRSHANTSALEVSKASVLGTRFHGFFLLLLLTLFDEFCLILEISFFEQEAVADDLNENANA
jgi:hypothetical protein